MSRFKFIPKSFTLIELLIVVSLISILSALVFMVINPERLRERARDANRKKDVLVISEALGQYYADNNAYPAGDISAIKSTLESGYMQVFPDTSTLCYSSTGTQNFRLCTYYKAMPDELTSGSGCFAADYKTTMPASGAFCVTNPF